MPPGVPYNIPRRVHFKLDWAYLELEKKQRSSLLMDTNVNPKASDAAEAAAEEERLAAEAAKAEEERIAAEAAAEAERLAAEAAKAEEERIAAEAAAEEERLAAEAAKAEEERIAAEAAAEEERLAAEAAKAEEDRIAAEAAAEEERLTAEAAKAEEDRIAAEAAADVVQTPVGTVTADDQFCNESNEEEEDNPWNSMVSNPETNVDPNVRDATVADCESCEGSKAADNISASAIDVDSKPAEDTQSDFVGGDWDSLFSCVIPEDNNVESKAADIESEAAEPDAASNRLQRLKLTAPPQVVQNQEPFNVESWKESQGELAAADPESKTSDSVASDAPAIHSNIGQGPVSTAGFFPKDSMMALPPEASEQPVQEWMSVSKPMRMLQDGGETPKVTSTKMSCQIPSCCRKIP